MSETAEQKDIVKWFRETWPEHRRSIRVSLAGLNFGSGPRAARMVNHVRAQGVEEGEADIVIALPKGGFGSLVIEHKKDDARRGVTDEHFVYIRYHNRIGNCAVVTKGIEMAKLAIIQYMEG